MNFRAHRANRTYCIGRSVAMASHRKPNRSEPHAKFSLTENRIPQTWASHLPTHDDPNQCGQTWQRNATHRSVTYVASHHDNIMSSRKTHPLRIHPQRHRAYYTYTSIYMFGQSTKNTSTTTSPKKIATIANANYEIHWKSKKKWEDKINGNRNDRSKIICVCNVFVSFIFQSHSE